LGGDIHISQAISPSLPLSHHHHHNSTQFPPPAAVPTLATASTNASSGLLACGNQYSSSVPTALPLSNHLHPLPGFPSSPSPFYNSLVPAPTVIHCDEDSESISAAALLDEEMPLFKRSTKEGQTERIRSNSTGFAMNIKERWVCHAQ